jgi:ProP effector
VAAREELARRKGLQQERLAAEREQMNLQQQQRHNRAGLLYDYERTTLTLANFCALKGVTPEELPGLLEIARKEAAERPPVREPRDAREPRRAGPAGRGGDARPEARTDRRPQNRGEGRGDGRPAAGDRRGPPRGKPGPR